MKLVDFLRSKKGVMRISDLAPLAIILVIISITVGMGATILTEMNNSSSVTGTAATVISDGISALGDFSGWFGIIVLVIIAAIIIGIVTTSFGGTARGV